MVGKHLYRFSLQTERVTGPTTISANMTSGNHHSSENLVCRDQIFNLVI